MELAGTSNLYFIWGIDDAPYGPVELPVLVDWIKDERVLADTWVFARSAGNWQRAGDIADLKKHFGPASAQPVFNKPAGKGITPGMLRRIKILADLNDAQLAHLSDFLELQEVLQWAVIFKQGDASDSMYLVMSGELRARTMVGGKETILATFGPGEFFGDMALFDHGPRSADVLANVDSTLFKISSASFDRLTREAPALATPFLQATARTLSARIRADNKRLTRIAQQFSASGVR
ncbi:MAG TPA: cyclic nucleotide-binding domain-containing protein [Verrucomicrobiae bacterium]